MTTIVHRVSLRMIAAGRNSVCAADKVSHNKSLLDRRHV